MTPTELAAELRQIDRAKAGARAALVKLEQREADLVQAHVDTFPFTLRGVTYEAWRSRSGRPYVRVTHG